MRSSVLLLLVVGCGGPAFTEATGEALGSLGTDAQTHDAAPTSPQDALSDAGGGEGAAEAESGPQRVTEPEAGACAASGASVCTGICSGNCTGRCTVPGGTPFDIVGAACGGTCNGTCDEVCCYR